MLCMKGGGVCIITNALFDTRIISIPNAVKVDVIVSVEILSPNGLSDLNFILVYVHLIARKKMTEI